MEQMSLFDYYGIKEEGKVEPLPIGSTVYTTEGVSITKRRILSSYTYSGGKVGYFTNHGSLTDDDVRINLFKTEDAAKEACKEWYKDHKEKVLLPADYKKKIVEKKVYITRRACDGKDLESFFELYENGSAYVKGYAEFAHLIQFKSLSEAEKMLKRKFTQQREEWKEVNKEISHKILYKCEDSCDWEYSEIGYNGILKD